ncbi:hypothetical protein AA313_de0202070 [Arthrobotrys entomopaga]|nr:hypothetical protein AA313_de0202070 [Arthrobotrys entomopaga]
MHLDGYQEDAGLWCARFCRWLELWGAKLVNLRLEALLFHRRITLLLPETQVGQLQKLSLHGLPFQFENFRNFLTLSGQRIEDLEFKGCILNDEKVDWFNMLKEIGQQCSRLREFAFSPDHRLVLRHSNGTKYALPCLKVKGLWGLEDTVCEVIFKCHDRDDFIGNYIGQKRLTSEIQISDTADVFWDSMTDGIWKYPDLFTSPL